MKPGMVVCSLVLLLFAVAIVGPVLGGEMEGPLSRSPAKAGEPWPEDHRLERIEFDNDGEWCRLIIPTKAPWAHWTLTDPPRIVVDLGQTVSLLPEAPGLYQARLDRGAIRVFRTAQHRYSELDHRVRITLELNQIVPYEARRIGDEIHILIPDRVQRTPRRLVLGAAGLAAMDRVPREAPRPDLRAIPDAPAPTPTQVPASAAASMAASTATSSPAPIPTPSPTPTLREALLALGVSETEEITPLADAARTLPFSAPQGARMEPASHRSTPATSGAPPAEAAEPNLPVVRSLSHAASSSPEETGGETDPIARLALLDPRERGASRLLTQAKAQFLKGEEVSAASTARRAHTFYAGTPSGDQSGILAREILALLDRPADAASILLPGTVVDTTRLGREIFLRLVARAQEKSDAASVERLLAEWAPRFGPVRLLGAVHLRQGEALLRSESYGAARERLRLIPPGDSLETRALLLIAVTHEREGEKQMAIDVYRQLDSLAIGRPERGRARARIADLEFQLGRVREALAGYEVLLQSDPPRDEEAWGVYQTGNCHYLLGDHDAARARYRQVLDRWPDSFWTPFARDRLEELSWRDQRAGHASMR